MNPCQCFISKVNELRGLGIRQLLIGLNVRDTGKKGKDCGEVKVCIPCKGLWVTGLVSCQIFQLFKRSQNPVHMEHLIFQSGHLNNFKNNLNNRNSENNNNKVYMTYNSVYRADLTCRFLVFIFWFSTCYKEKKLNSFWVPNI